MESLTSTAITIEIQRLMAEIVRLKKSDPASPQIRQLTAKIDELAQRRRSLVAA